LKPSRRLNFALLANRVRRGVGDRASVSPE
jgi:hypothetical protein